MAYEYRVKPGLTIHLKILFISVFLCGQLLLAQNCNDALEDAIEYFGVQKYNEIITLLTDCPPNNIIDETQQTLAYELLAYAYYTNNQPDSAASTLNRVLDNHPDYNPDPSQYTDEFAELVKQLKEERTPLFSKAWFWIGGVAVTTLAAILIFQDSGGQEKQALLPEAPDPPNVQ